MPYSLDVCDKLIESFHTAKNNEDNNADEDGDGAITAFASLRTVDALIVAVRNRPDLLDEMERKMFPILFEYSSRAGEVLVEEICSITTTLLYYKKSVSDQMWTLWPRFHEMATDWA